MASKEIIAEKQKVVDGMKEKIQACSSFVLVDYMGLTVTEDTAFRKELRDNGVQYAVVKNRLVKRALDDLGITNFDDALNGPTAVAFSSDAVAPARIVMDNIKKLKKMTVKGGMVEGAYYDEAGLKQIASIPSKEVLLAKMLGSMQSPIAKLAICLNKIAEQKEQNA